MVLIVGMHCTVYFVTVSVIRNDNDDDGQTTVMV